MSRQTAVRAVQNPVELPQSPVSQRLVLPQKASQTTVNIMSSCTCKASPEDDFFLGIFHSVCCELAQTGLTTAGAAQLLSAGAASAKPDRRTERELSDLLTLQA